MLAGGGHPGDSNWIEINRAREEEEGGGAEKTITDLHAVSLLVRVEEEEVRKR